MSKEKRHVRTNICIDPFVWERILKLKSIDFNINISAICSRALNEWLDENEWRAAERPNINTMFSKENQEKLHKA